MLGLEAEFRVVGEVSLLSTLPTGRPSHEPSAHLYKTAASDGSHGWVARHTPAGRVLT